MTTPTAAVVVCAYALDRWDDLRASIGSAATQSPAPDELLIVVDHNRELFERAARELVRSHPLLRVVENEQRRGLSGARNTALDLVGSDVVVFLDDDAAAEPGWLARLIAPYADPSVIAVGGAATPRWPADAARPSTLPVSASGRGELDWVVGCTYEGQPGRRQPVRNLMGCNMSFRREVFAAIGGFSDDLGRIGKTPLGCEETEFCIRASQSCPDAEIVFEPRALVRHRVSPDRLTWRYLRRRCFAEGLSKAAVSAMVGSDRALATERGYARAVLPTAVRRELAAALHLTAADRSRSLARAGAILFALAFTTLGYVRGRLAVGSRTRQQGTSGRATTRQARPVGTHRCVGTMVRRCVGGEVGDG
jgi:glucosyl-dolichyl phosphate glucuronosyltransferase